MNAGPFASLIADFAQNWATQRPALTVSLTGVELEVDPDHPLHGDLDALCKGRSASLPFFSSSSDVVWCTVAPNSDSLRHAVAALGAWALPSFGGTIAGDGYIRPDSAKSEFAAKIIAASPDGYYRWRSPKSKVDQVFTKLQLRRTLEQTRPVQNRPRRPSLYELRARFASALIIGDRDGAEQIINQLDLFQLETAVNTQFMRIRMWHHFGELDRIRDHSDLPHLLAQPLPSRVREWINAALGTTPAPTPAEPAPPPTPEALPAPTETPPPTPTVQTWCDWFNALKVGDRTGALTFLSEHSDARALDLSPDFIESLSNSLDDLVLDDTLRTRERGLILQGVSELLEAYLREQEFPRAPLGNFYLSLLHLWGATHAGNSAGREHGHVFLELASALLRLNQCSDEVCRALEDWWKAKPAPSQLYFALDAIELMERELPDPKPAMNLWVDVADVIKRAVDSLPSVDRELWRRVGTRLGFDEVTISEYLPPELQEEKGSDPLAESGLQHVAIVCLRDKQAKQAAEEIEERTGAKVTVVSDTAAGGQTTQACTSDVVLFVWLASTHAVFRAFDGYDRKKFCYVQGTGASSIVRSLERWVIST